ncbi:VOC family protein [Streptomyces sp. NPDC059979]|uniref:VOC family protein n=1 Tax=Streptomyces sp. NPDC059979 TaxID=3347021 RepID=UPI0036B5BFC8
MLAGRRTRLPPLSYDDVEAAEQVLLAAGATKPDHQPGGQAWTVLLDPSGQPLCISANTSPAARGPGRWSSSAFTRYSRRRSAGPRARCASRPAWPQSATARSRRRRWRACGKRSGSAGVGRVGRGGVKSVAPLPARPARLPSRPGAVARGSAGVVARASRAGSGGLLT